MGTPGLSSLVRRNDPVVDEPVTEIGRERARRTKRFFTAQLGVLGVIMVALAIVAISNIAKREHGLVGRPARR